MGPFGAKPARASAFIGVAILMDTEALAGFAMPARASTFNSIDCTNSLGCSGGPPRGPPDAENRRLSEPTNISGRRIIRKKLPKGLGLFFVTACAITYIL